MMGAEFVLFQGMAGTERVYTAVRVDGDAVLVESQSIGPLAENLLGDREVEAFVTIPATSLGAIVQALSDETDQTPATAAKAAELLAERFRGDSSAFTAIRQWLTSKKIPHKTATF